MEFKDGQIILITFNDDSDDTFQIDEHIIVVQFISNEQKINISISCRDTDNFIKCKEKLYDEYPELKNKNFYFYFLTKGYLIKQNATLEENGIENGDVILFYEKDEDKLSNKILI